MQKYLDPTNDSLFKKIFSDLDRLKEFLNSILNLPEKHRIKEINFLSPEQLPRISQGKKSVFDLKVKDESGHWYIIEMQKRNERDYLKRLQYYSAHSYVQQLTEGVTHDDLLPIVVISLMKSKIFAEEVPYINFHKVIETTTKKQQHIFDISYVFIELKKFQDIKQPLLSIADEWLHLFKYATKENTPPAGIKSSKVLEAYHVIEMHGLTSEEYDLYVRCKLQEDAEDIALEERFKEGKAEGEAIGEARGEEKRAITTTKEMLIDNEPIEKIAKYTKLTIEEIKVLKEELENSKEE